VEEVAARDGSIHPEIAVTGLDRGHLSSISLVRVDRKQDCGSDTSPPSFRRA